MAEGGGWLQAEAFSQHGSVMTGIRTKTQAHCVQWLASDRQCSWSGLLGLEVVSLDVGRVTPSILLPTDERAS